MPGVARRTRTDSSKVIDVQACRDAVAAWREHHFDSVRQASAAARITNETWSNFEDGTTKSVTPTIRDAMMRLFGWPRDWPHNPPTAPQPGDQLPNSQTIPDQLTEILSHLGESPSRAELASRLTQLADEIRKLGESVSSIDTTVTSVLSTVGRVEKTCGNVDAMMKRVDAILPPPPARPVVAPPGKVTTRR